MFDGIDCDELSEPNKDDNLSEIDKAMLRNAMLDILNKHPKYKEWIYSVEFGRVNFNSDDFVKIFVYMNDVDINYIDVLDIERNILEGNELFGKMLYECSVIGSLGYDKKILSKENIFIKSLLREEKINSLLQ